MIIYLLIACAVIFLAGGVFFIRRAYEPSENDQKAVPISDFKEIKGLGGQEQEETSLSVENKQLAEALKREVSSKETNAISDQEKKEVQKKEEEVVRAQQSIKELTEENYELKKQMDDQKTKVNQFFESVSAAREDFGKEIEDYQKNIEALECELKQFRQEKTAFVEKNKSIEQLEAETKNLAVQVNKSEEEIKRLKDDLEAAKALVEQQKVEEMVVTDQLPASEESEVLPGNAVKTELAETTRMIEKLMTEKEELRRDKVNLELDFSKIEELNEHLLEKEKKLQNELIKNRAQSYGLERVCEDFKVQIETMSKSLEGK